MAPRYHPGVIWGPFLLALALGVIVSAGLYFAYLWPQVEPLDDEEEAAGGPVTSGTSAQTEAATEDPAPTRESSPA